MVDWWSARGTVLAKLRGTQASENSTMVQALRALDLEDVDYFVSAELSVPSPELGEAEVFALQALLLSLRLAIKAGSTRVDLQSFDAAPIMSALGASRELVAKGQGILREIGSRAHQGDDSPYALSPWIGQPGQRKPVIVWQGFAYAQRHFEAEQRIAECIKAKLLARGRTPLTAKEHAEFNQYMAHNTPKLNQEQIEAVRMALEEPLALITGGPGTGKTSIVVSLLRLLREWKHVPSNAIALCAATGKAANRLQEVLRDNSAPQKQLSFENLVNTESEIASYTLHRLLAYSPSKATFGFHEHNVLPQSWVVVDETTMVDVDLMLALMLALPEDAHLVLLGDADQLPSIDPGAVFSDLGKAENVPKVILHHNYRRPSDQPPFTDLSNAKVDTWFAVSNTRELGVLLEDWFQRYVLALLQRDLSLVLPDYGVAQDVDLSESLLHALREQGKAQLLCVTRKLALGSEALNRWFMGRAWRHAFARRGAAYVPGTPIIVTRNDYELGIYNGDVGIVVSGQEDDVQGVVFQRFDRGFYVPLERIDQNSEPAFALTVHKAQGSEYDHVLLMLPQEDSPLLTRQLLYTAMTRARQCVWVAGDRALWLTGNARHQARSTGLLEHLS